MLDERSNVRDEMIDSYLRDTLPDEERAQVELWMLEDPQFFAKVQEFELIQDSFRNKKEQPSIKPSVPSSKPVLATKVFTYFRGWIAHPISIAASFLLLLNTALVISNGTENQGTTPIQNGLALNSVITIDQNRSAANEIILVGDAHLLRIDVGINLDETQYQLVLSDAEGGQQFRYVARPDPNGILRLLTPSDLSGRYVLSIQQTGSEQSVQAYNIQFN